MRVYYCNSLRIAQKEPRTDRTIENLCRINSMLLKADQLDLSVSLLTNDYIIIVLNRMEEIP